VVAVGHILWVATDAGRVVRWHLGSGEEHDVVIDKGRNDVIFKLHVDPSGYHLIIGGNQGDNWYLPVARSLKPRILTMTKGARIESVCWDKEGSDDASTGNILVGTSRGGIYKACIIDSKERLWREVFALRCRLPAQTTILPN